MRWRGLIVASLGAASIGTACTSTEQADTTTIAEPTTTVATSTTVALSTTTSTVVESSTSSAAPQSSTSTPDGALRILRTDGIGPVDFGTPADDAIAALKQLLGEPDGGEFLGPDRNCDEEPGWKECLPVVDAGEILRWTDHGLEVVVSDYGGLAEPAVPAYIRSWRVIAPARGAGMATTEGLELGMTFEQAVRLYPTASIEIIGDEGLLVGVNLYFGGGRAVGDMDAFYVEFDGWAFTDQVKALQQALNKHGADLEVDGVVGEATTNAWMEFCQSRALDCMEPPGWISDPANSAALDLDLRSRTIASLIAGFGASQ